MKGRPMYTHRRGENFHELDQRLVEYRCRITQNYGPDQEHTKFWWSVIVILSPTDVIVFLTSETEPKVQNSPPVYL